MSFYKEISELEVREIIPGFFGRFIHMDTYSLAFWEIKSGSALPEHAHIHEQSSQVLEGRFEMTVNGETRIYEPGMVVTIPSNIPHSGKALTDCKLIDVFCPVREDYK